MRGPGKELLDPPPSSHPRLPWPEAALVFWLWSQLGSRWGQDAALAAF